MKRKTNLFYVSGDDAKFLTFSNYTECMTGNFLSVNTKLFPSKFLCLYIDTIETRDGKVDTEQKKKFIEGLVSYYENKLAFLRDKCVEADINPETRIRPLGYLLDYIYSNAGIVDVQYVGQVTEQDYNGIYADTICVIDMLQANKSVIRHNTELGRASERYTYPYDTEDTADPMRGLYGWCHKVGDGFQYDGPADFKNVAPKYDNETAKAYFYDSGIDGIEITQIDPSSFTEDNEHVIKFNVIIPLFDIINVDHVQNTDLIQSLDYIDCNDDAACVINVPYGIWFANERIELRRDGTEYSPSWSLSIGSQFKPFPYSQQKVSEIDQSDRSSAFMTFSQILIRQNRLLDKMSSMTTDITALNNRLSYVEANLKSVGTAYNIDGMHKEMVDMRTSVRNRFRDVRHYFKNVSTAISSLASYININQEDIDDLRHSLKKTTYMGQNVFGNLSTNMEGLKRSMEELQQKVDSLFGEDVEE